MVQSALRHFGQELPEGFPVISELPASLLPRMRAWAHSWRMAHGDAPASGALARLLVGYVVACGADEVCHLERKIPAAEDELREAKDKLREAKDELREAKDELREAKGNLLAAAANGTATEIPLLLFNTTQQAVAEAQKAVAEAQKAVAEAQQAVAEAQRARVIAAPETDGAVSAAIAAVDRHLAQPPADGPGTTLMLASLAPAQVYPDAKESLHQEEPSIPLNDIGFGSDLGLWVRQFQDRALYAAPGLRDEPFGTWSSPNHEGGPRFVRIEDELGPPFQVELFLRAKRIITTLRSHVKVWVVPGDPRNHADIFMMVSVAQDDTHQRLSAVVVELKMPRGSNTWRPPPTFSDDSPWAQVVAALAPMVDERFTRLVLQQVHAYSRDTEKACRIIDRRFINRRYAIVSTFNELWILRYNKDAASLQQHQRLLDEANRQLDGDRENAVLRAAVAQARGERDSADQVMVSPRFCVESTQPHPAFAVAYVLDRVVQDMEDNPNEYPEVDTRHLVKTGDIHIPPIPRQSRCQSSAEPSSRRGSNNTRSGPATQSMDSGRVTKLAPPPAAVTGWKQLTGNIVIGEHLGDGRSGAVHAGTINGQPVALKISGANADAEIFQEFINEVDIYRLLEDLQGNEIARLLDCGLLDVEGSTRAVIVLELIQDSIGANCPEDERAAQLSLSVRQNALNALGKIHKRGVVHGDPRMLNVLFEQADIPGLAHNRAIGSLPMHSVIYSHLSSSMSTLLSSPLSLGLSLPLKPRFIDLAFAIVNPDDEAFDDDLKGWGKVLDLPEYE
ncbi:hypothetical protein GGF43_000543 [Coemansia sp. RSA 2618]|nr:hypothetical protein GGF43_000543 [Coemansia sp. RSA 2618]